MKIQSLYFERSVRGSSTVANRDNAAVPFSTPAVGTPAVGTPAVGTPAVGTPAVYDHR